jgi:hypothetical protein
MEYFSYNNIYWCHGAAEVKINILKPNGNFTYQQVQRSKILRGAHIAFMCFTRISEQTAIFTLYIIKWLVFITEVESVYSAVRTESLYKTDTLRL